MLLLAGGGLAWAQSGPSAPAYRTATVRSGDVGSQLALTGLVHVVNQARAAFPVPATVQSVRVTVGQHVTAGQVLATIDPTALQSAVVDATAALARAQETLQTDQSAAAPTAAPVVPVAPAPTPSAKAAAAPGKPAASTALTHALTAVRQQAASAQSALGAATTACGGAAGATGPGAGAAGGPGRGGPRSSPQPTPTAAPSPSPTDSPSPSPSPTTTSSPTAAPAVDQAACLAALRQALSAQQVLSRDQSSASRLLSAGGPSTADASTSTTRRVATTGTRAAATVTSAASSLSSGSSGTGTGSAGRTGTSGGSGGITSPAARVTVDSAAVQAAQVTLTSAQQTLAAARLTSPLTGTVAIQPFSAGQAESSSQAIVVIGAGEVQVTANAPASAVTSLRVGQQAVVTPDGSRSSVPGTVSELGLLPVTAANGALTYPVTVLVPRPGTGFHDGGGASLGIVTRTVRDALVVPDSALVNGTVSVVRAGRLIPTRVQVGVVGPLMAQILSGVQRGELVLLADPGKALPANSTTPTRTFVGGVGPGPGAGPGGRGVGGAAALPGG